MSQTIGSQKFTLDSLAEMNSDDLDSLISSMVRIRLQQSVRLIPFHRKDLAPYRC